MTEKDSVCWSCRNEEPHSPTCLQSRVFLLFFFVNKNRYYLWLSWNMSVRQLYVLNISHPALLASVWLLYILNISDAGLLLRFKSCLFVTCFRKDEHISDTCCPSRLEVFQQMNRAISPPCCSSRLEVSTDKHISPTCRPSRPAGGMSTDEHISPTCRPSRLEVCQQLFW